MKRGFYAKLAFTGIRKNKRLYVPYILTCIGMVMMFYIVAFLSYSPVLTGIPGGDTLQMILSLGTGVVGVFALIFLFYTNSFLMRRRKKEFLPVVPYQRFFSTDLLFGKERSHLHEAGCTMHAVRYQI